MELKEMRKTIYCEFGNPDTSIVEGTSKELADMAYRYDSDFSDNNLEEIRQFAAAVLDEESVNKMTWLLESRDEISMQVIALNPFSFLTTMRLKSVRIVIRSSSRFPELTAMDIIQLLTACLWMNSLISRPAVLMTSWQKLCTITLCIPIRSKSHA